MHLMDHFTGPYKHIHGLIFDSQDRIILEVRGWGYLTGSGSGGLGLNPESAANLQDSFGAQVAELLNAEATRRAKQGKG